MCPGVTVYHFLLLYQVNGCTRGYVGVLGCLSDAGGQLRVSFFSSRCVDLFTATCL